MYIYYSANNSGGSFWHTNDQWQKLLDLGWVDIGACRLLKKVNSFKEGMQEWQSVMQVDPDEVGCECCGPPHFFEVWENLEAESAIQEYRAGLESQ